MNKKVYTYVEITPSDGFVLTNGEIFTKYVSCLKDEESKWSEVSIDELTDEQKKQFENNKELK